MTDYSEILLDSVSQLVDAKLKDVSYDTTDVYTIIDDNNAENGIYKVTDNRVVFDAYSENRSYREQDQVYVTVPRGDLSKQKIIVGKYISEEEIKLSPDQYLVHKTIVSGNSDGGSLHLKEDHDSNKEQIITGKSIFFPSIPKDYSAYRTKDLLYSWFDENQKNYYSKAFFSLDIKKNFSLDISNEPDADYGLKIIVLYNGYSNPAEQETINPEEAFEDFEIEVFTIGKENLIGNLWNAGKATISNKYYFELESEKKITGLYVYGFEISKESTEEGEWQLTFPSDAFKEFSLGFSTDYVINSLEIYSDESNLYKSDDNEDNLKRYIKFNWINNNKVYDGSETIGKIYLQKKNIQGDYEPQDIGQYTLEEFYKGITKDGQQLPPGIPIILDPQLNSNEYIVYIDYNNEELYSNSLIFTNETFIQYSSAINCISEDSGLFYYYDYNNNLTEISTDGKLLEFSTQSELIQFMTDEYEWIITWTFPDEQNSMIITPSSVSKTANGDELSNDFFQIEYSIKNQYNQDLIDNTVSVSLTIATIPQPNDSDPIIINNVSKTLEFGYIVPLMDNYRFYTNIISLNKVVARQTLGDGNYESSPIDVECFLRYKGEVVSEVKYTCEDPNGSFTISPREEKSGNFQINFDFTKSLGINLKPLKFIAETNGVILTNYLPIGVLDKTTSELDNININTKQIYNNDRLTNEKGVFPLELKGISAESVIRTDATGEISSVYPLSYRVIFTDKANDRITIYKTNGKIRENTILSSNGWEKRQHSPTLESWYKNGNQYARRTAAAGIKDTVPIYNSEESAVAQAWTGSTGKYRVIVYGSRLSEGQWNIYKGDYLRKLVTLNKYLNIADTYYFETENIGDYITISGNVKSINFYQLSSSNESNDTIRVTWKLQTNDTDILQFAEGLPRLTSTLKSGKGRDLFISPILPNKYYNILKESSLIYGQQQGVQDDDLPVNLQLPSYYADFWKNNIGISVIAVTTSNNIEAIIFSQPICILENYYQEADINNWTGQEELNSGLKTETALIGNKNSNRFFTGSKLDSSGFTIFNNSIKSVNFNQDGKNSFIGKEMENRTYFNTSFNNSTYPLLTKTSANEALFGFNDSGEGFLKTNNDKLLFNNDKMASISSEIYSDTAGTFGGKIDYSLGRIIMNNLIKVNTVQVNYSNSNNTEIEKYDIYIQQMTSGYRLIAISDENNNTNLAFPYFFQGDSINSDNVKKQSSIIYTTTNYVERVPILNLNNIPNIDRNNTTITLVSVDFKDYFYDFLGYTSPQSYDGYYEIGTVPCYFNHYNNSATNLRLFINTAWKNSSGSPQDPIILKYSALIPYFEFSKISALKIPGVLEVGNVSLGGRLNYNASDGILSLSKMVSNGTYYSLRFISNYKDDGTLEFVGTSINGTGTGVNFIHRTVGSENRNDFCVQLNGTPIIAYDPSKGHDRQWLFDNSEHGFIAALKTALGIV